ncbi:2-hydroxyacid dehydrogenase [Rhodopila sp.]|uniref:2-hydroxyacid dehydrogenase n=1 Tax=Rhodopila sp. TaxID=2480087 RepID=UPI003D1172DF
MAKPVLFVTRRLPASIEALAEQGYEARLTASEVAIPDLLARADGADAILCCPGDLLDAKTVAALPGSVKVIGTFSVGLDHIDLAAAKARGIKVCNTPDVLSVATAECAMLLLMAAARRAGEGERLVRSGKWAGWAPTQLLGTGLSGQRLGIFGMGRIGREIARMGRGFGMEVHYRDMTRMPSQLELGAIFHDNDDSFLPLCQFLSMNAPGGDGTMHWLNQERIAKLPFGAVVANAARGTLVDDTALIAALRSGQIAAAGLDVYNGEPRLNAEYLTLENVVLLPHLGSATTTTRDAMGQVVLSGIGAALVGETPSNLVG